MRTAFSALFAALVLLAACQADVAVSPPEKQQTLFQAPELSPFVRMNQANAERHIVSGVYALEADAWRWAGKQAVLRLHLEQTANLKFVMKFAVPEPVIKQNGPVKLAILLNGRRWHELRYAKDGIYEFEKPAPAEFLKANDENLVTIEIDKPLPPRAGGRELGFILVHAGFQ